jgi:hypothetical protein
VMVSLSPPCCYVQARFLGIETKILFLFLWGIQHYKKVFKALHLFLKKYVAEFPLPGNTVVFSSAPYHRVLNRVLAWLHWLGIHDFHRIV